jgi:AraC-like DNA-binding protein
MLIAPLTGANVMQEAPGLAYWSAAVFGRTTIEEAAYARMCAHARFPDACATAARSILRRLEGNSLMSRAVKDLSRVFYGVFALYLDARDELTLTGIQEFCEETGLASPGRAAAALLQLRMLGYVVLDPASAGMRRRRFLPTPMMKQGLLDVFRDQLLAMSLVEPEAATAAERMADPDVFRKFVLILGAGFAKIAGSGASTVITPFADRNAGLAIFFHIALSGETSDTYPPQGLVRMSVKDIARRFAVSRSHVFRLLRDAESEGLLRRNADEATGLIEDVMREAMLFLHAVTFMGTASCIYRAMCDAPGAGQRLS